MEGKIASNYINALAIPNVNDEIKTWERQETNNRSSSEFSISNGRCQIGVGVAKEQILISVHLVQKNGSKNESHVVLGDDGVQFWHKIWHVLWRNELFSLLDSIKGTPFVPEKVGYWISGVLHDLEKFKQVG